MPRTEHITADSAKLQKRVLILHTGGTFGMVLSPTQESKPQPQTYLNAIFSHVPELKQIAHLELKILCNLDSSDITPAVWTTLAQTIVNEWDMFDGFVVIHGTDTMAYSATALSFFLPNLSKPVVFTGSQRPLSSLRNDARTNIIDAVELATVGFPEVMVCFDSTVHRGTRATKHSNEHLHAFRSHNDPSLGHFGVHFTLNTKLAQKPVPETLRTKPNLDARLEPNILSLDSVPGITLSDALIDALLASVQGLVIRGFGVGNLPIVTDHWKKLCQKALACRIPVVMASQCVAGAISLDAYENGRIYRDLGVISGLDMSFESASVKLMVMLGRQISFDRRHEFFATPLAMELGGTQDIVDAAL